MKRALKYFLRLLLAVLAALVLLFVALQTSWVRSWVKGEIESAVTGATNGTLSIQGLGGTLLGNAVLDGVVLQVEGDTLASLNRLEVEFSVVGLLSQVAAIDELQLEGLDIRIAQLRDSSWNIDRLSASKVTDTVTAQPAGPFPWVIRAEVVRLLDGNVSVIHRRDSAGGSLIIRQILLNGSVEYSEKKKEFRIDSLAFVMQNPELELRHLSVDAEMTDRALVVSRAQVVTAANRIDLSGQLGLRRGIPSTVEISTSALELSELPGLPAIVGRDVHPALKGTLQLSGDDLTADVVVQRDEEWIRCAGSVGRLSTDLVSSVDVELRQFDLGAWFPGLLPPSSVTGRLHVEGRGLDPLESPAELEMSLSSSRAFGRSVDSLDARVHVGDFAGRSRVVVRAPSGSASVEMTVRDLRTLTGYEAEVQAEHLDLSELLQDEGLRSDIALRAHLSGSGTSSSSATASATVWAQGDFGVGIDVDTMEASAEFAGGRLAVRNLHLVTAELIADLAGAVGLDQSWSAGGKVQLLDSAPLLALAGLDGEVLTSGDIEFDLGGRADSLGGELAVELSGTSFEELSADSVAGAAMLLIENGNLALSGRVSALNLVGYGVKSETVEAEARYGRDELQLSSSLDFGGGLEVSLGGRAMLGDTISANLSSLSVKAGGDRWEKDSDTIRISVAGSRIELGGFALRSGQQALTIGGVYDPEDSVDIRISVDSTNLQPASTYAILPVKATGTVTADVHIGGTVARPHIESSIQARALAFDEQEVGDVRATASAADSGIEWQLAFTDRFGNTILSVGHAPYVVGFTGVSVTGDSALSASLETEGYDLKWIRSMREEFGEVAGTISANLHLDGTIARPALNGTVRLRNGVLTIPSIGLDVRELVLDASADRSRIRLDSLRARIGRGTLSASGVAAIPLTGADSRADSIDVVVNADQISINAARRYEAQIDGSLRAVYVNDALEYSGSIEIPQSRVYLPSLFTAMSSGRRSTDRPLLVQATLQADTASFLRADSARRARRGAPVIGQKTVGRVALSLPKNTWIQSPNVNAEIYGDLMAIQTDTLFELEGTLTISRGTVQLLGKRFIVRRGNAVFSRGPKIDPVFTLELEYRFRDANRQDRYLTARLTGTTTNPNLTWSLDEKMVTQQDAVSYIIFGRSVDELTLNQQSSVTGGDDNVAGAMAFDMLGAQLSNMIAQRVGLDVVEIKSTDGAKAGTLTAGKYIAEGVFISYEKGFGEYGVNETIPEVFTIEYELIRSFFIQFVQANDRRSGADVIIKIE